MFSQDQKVDSDSNTLNLPLVTSAASRDPDIVFKRYFHKYYFAGSGKNELMTAACFLQAFINNSSGGYFLAKSPEHNEHWKQYISFIVTFSFGTQQESKDTAKTNSLHFKRQLTIINKCIIQANIKHYFSPATLEKQSDKNAYLEVLFNELDYFIWLLLEKPQYAPQSAELEIIYSTDFSSLYLKHEVLEAEAVKFKNDEEKKNTFFNEFYNALGELMHFADISSCKQMANITQVDGVIYTGALLRNSDDMRKCIDKYFNFNEIIGTYQLTTSYAEKMFFLTSVYLSAAMILLRIKSPQELVPNDSRIRAVISKLEIEEQEQRQQLLLPLHQIDLVRANGIFYSPVPDLRNKFEPIKLTFITNEFIMNFCNHECKGNIPALLNHSPPPPYFGNIFAPAYFDINERKLKWIIQNEKQMVYQSKIKKNLNEEMISSTLNLVYDDYSKKLTYLVKLYYAACNQYKLYASDVKVIEPSFIIEDFKALTSDDLVNAFDKITNLTRRYLLTGVEPFDSEYMTEFNKQNPNFNPVAANTNSPPAAPVETQNMPGRLYKPVSSDLDVIYGTEFATLYLNHPALEAEAAEFKNNLKREIEFYSDIYENTVVLMNYADSLSHENMRRVTGVVTERIATPTDETKNFLKKYFNIDKIDRDHLSKQTYGEKLKFITHVYTSAYLIQKNVIKRLRAKSGESIPRFNITYKIDKNQIKTEIEKLEKQYNETKVIPVNEDKEEKSIPAFTTNLYPKTKMKNKKPDKRVSSPSKPMEQDRKTTQIDSDSKPSELRLFENSYHEAKKIADNLDATIKPLQEQSQSLLRKLKQTLSQDEKGAYVTEEHKNRVKQLNKKVEDLIKIVKAAIQADIIALEYKDEAKLESNKQTLTAIKTKLNELQSNQDKLCKEMEKEIAILDHIIPKKTAKEQAAELVKMKKAQQALAKEEKKKQAEAEKKKKLELEKSKPSTKPVTQLQSPATKPLAPAAKKPEFKKPAARTAPAEEKTLIRIHYLNQACKNLILIHKMLEMYQTEVTAEVLHYALLYNIFRCFQSLKMYQEHGGNKQDINSDEVINLRHMIAHHGASAAHPEEIINFAKDIKGKLSKTISGMKNKKDYLISYELSYEDRQGLMEFSGFAPHGNLVIEESRLYQKLQKFHETKDNNDDSANISILVLEKYIPMMRNILAKLNKENPPNKKIIRELFVENYLFQLQALRMLATICGEFMRYFKEYEGTNLYSFLYYCHLDIRNSVAHDMQDNFDVVDFYFTLNSSLAKINEKNLLTAGNGNITSTPAAFFHHGSAMDVKYDRPQTSFKP
jgi:hypothetical protein